MLLGCYAAMHVWNKDLRHQWPAKMLDANLFWLLNRTLLILQLSSGTTDWDHIYTLSPRKNGPPKHALKFSKLASFARFQCNSMNICLFSIKVPILVKICLPSLKYWHSINGLKSLRFPEAWFLTYSPWS